MLNFSSGQSAAIERSRLLRIAAVAAVLAGFAAALSVAAPGYGGSTQKQVFKSAGCKEPVNPYGPMSWACTTITVNPETVHVGDSTTLTYTFKARHKIRYVKVCFTKVASDACAYMHKFATINRGRTIKRVLHSQTPQTPGDYGLDNLSRVYKAWTTEERGVAYWETNDGNVQVVSAPGGTTTTTG